LSTNNSFHTVGTPGPFSTVNDFESESDLAALLATTSLDARQSGFIGGGQLGGNYQFATSWVAGFEADIQGLTGEDTARSSTSMVNPTFANETFFSTTKVSKEVDWLGTVRGRLGVLATPTLLAYGTGGFAYGGVKAKTSISQQGCGIFGTCGVDGDNVNYNTSGSFSDTLTGWTAGGGFEWRFAPRWTLKSEYLYYDLGNVSFRIPDLVAVDTSHGDTVPTWSAHVRSTTQFKGNIVRAGINYLF
jgi:outer membrane immunogenic protein